MTIGSAADGTVAGGDQRSYERLLSLPLVAILLVGTIPPLFVLLWTSFHSIGPDGSYNDFTLSNYAELAAAPDFYAALFNAIVYSFGSALLAIAIGAVQAWLAERSDAPFRQFLYLSSIISLGVPYVLYIVAWILFLGNNGPMNALLRSFFGGSGVYVSVYSLGGMIFVEGMLWSPLAFLLLSAIFRNADASYEDAAAICGARLPTILRRITFGMAKPAVFALGLLVFVRAAESFEVPALLGLPSYITVLTTSIYNKLQHAIPPDVGGAAAFGGVLLVLMSVLLKLYSRMTAEAHKYRTITGKGFRPRMVRLGRWRPVAGFFVLAVPFVTIVVPVIMLLWTALLPFYQLFSIRALSLLTLDNFKLVLSAEPYLQSMKHSLILAGSTATAVIGITAIVGWSIARHMRGGRLMDVLAAVPLAFPAIVFSFAFLQIYLNVLPFVYNSLISLVIVSAVAFLPYGVRYAQLGSMQIHPELEEAASLAGARFRSIFFRIVVPLLAPALISGWLFIFLLSARAMSLVLLLVGPDSAVIAVSLFDLWNNGQLNELAALGILWTMVMTIFSFAFYWVARRFQLPFT